MLSNRNTATTPPISKPDQKVTPPTLPKELASMNQRIEYLKKDVNSAMKAVAESVKA